MSVIRKKPFIEDKLGKLTAEQLTSLKSVVNTQSTGDTYYSLIDNDDSLQTYLSTKTTEIKAIRLRLDKEHIRNGIVIYNNAQQTYPMCVFITYHSYQDLATYELDLVHSKATKINEELTIEELRRVVDILGVEAGGGASEWEQAIKDKLIYDSEDNQVQCRVGFYCDGDIQVNEITNLVDEAGNSLIPDPMGHAGKFLKAGTTGLVWDTPFTNNNKVIAVSEADWEDYVPLTNIVYVVYNPTTHQCTTYFYTE